MTEENRSPSDDESPVAGAGAARQDDEAPAARPEAPRATMIDQEQPVPVDDPEEPPAAPEPGDRHVAGGFTPPDGPADAPVAMPAGPPPEQPRPWGSPAGPDAPPHPRQRPGFVPHDAPANPYGWHGGPQQQVPPQPPLNGQPPLGPRPMAGYGQQPPPPGTGPNWAPVPPPPPSALRGPGLGLIAIIVAVVALVSAGVGAGVAVLASDDDQGTVSLGGDGGGGGGAVSRPPDSVAGIARRVLPSVVMIRVKSATEEGAGTGFIVNGGYIVTNNHVAAGAGQGGQIQIVFNDKKTLPATVKGTDPSSDVAVLKPEGQHDLPALALGNSDQIAVGDPVIAIGSPLGLQGSVTTGIVSSLNRAVPTQSENGGDATYLNAIQTDAAINPGNSGGPLVDTKGRVIGMNTAIATLGSQSLQGQSQSGSIGLGFAIPINQARRVAQEIINNGSVKQAKMGVLPDPRSQDGAKIMEQPVQGQQPITPGGPADKAGLKPGDVITKVDSQPIEDASDLIALIRSKAPGDKIKVTYVRNGKENTVELTLAAG